MAVNTIEKIMSKIPHNSTPVFVGKYNDHDVYLGRYSITTSISLNTNTKLTDYFPVESKRILGIWGAIYSGQTVYDDYMKVTITGKTLNVNQSATSGSAEYVIWYLYTDYQVH